VRPARKVFWSEGKLIQKNVPDDFVLRVPVYGKAQSGKPVLLATSSRRARKLRFIHSRRIAEKLLIDPQMTLLCLPPSSSSLTAE